jgi:pimeloyl-ACP methyl ester carboxylesterase
MKNNMNYIEEGEGQDLLFFHGIGVTPDSYKNTIDELARDFHVVAPHIKAFRNIEENEKNVSSLVERLGLKNIIVVGHSAGGIAAYNFILGHSKNVRALALIDPAGAGLKKPVLTLLIRCIKPALELRSKNKEALKRILKASAITMLNPIEAYRNANFVSGYSFKEQELPVPVLIIHGKDDSLLPLISSEKIQKNIPGSKLETVEGNHNWLMIKPDFLAKKIKEFVE